MSASFSIAAFWRIASCSPTMRSRVAVWISGAYAIDSSVIDAITTCLPLIRRCTSRSISSSIFSLFAASSVYEWRANTPLAALRNSGPTTSS